MSSPIPPIVNPNLYLVIIGVNAVKLKVASINAKNVANLFTKVLYLKPIKPTTIKDRPI
jgi:hypothetical protein